MARTRVIGRGTDFLREWILKCHRAGGIPIIKTKMVREFSDRVIVMCWQKGKEVPGGTVLLDPVTVKRIKEVGWKEALGLTNIPFRKLIPKPTQVYLEYKRRRA